MLDVESIAAAFFAHIVEIRRRDDITGVSLGDRHHPIPDAVVKLDKSRRHWNERGRRVGQGSPTIETGQCEVGTVLGGDCYGKAHPRHLILNQVDVKVVEGQWGKVDLSRIAPGVVPRHPGCAGDCGHASIRRGDDRGDNAVGIGSTGEPAQRTQVCRERDNVTGRMQQTG